MTSRREVAGPIVSETTRDQSVTYGKAENLGGAFTGMHEVDMMLESFRRSPTFEAA